MPVGVIFWVFMIIWAVLGVAATRGDAPYFAWGGNLLLFILLLLLGWRVFGWIVQG